MTTEMIVGNMINASYSAWQAHRRHQRQDASDWLRRWWGSLNGRQSSARVTGAARLRGSSSGVLLALAVILGGSTTKGIGPEWLLQLAALALIAALAVQQPRIPSPARWALLILGAGLAVVGGQLVPLPPEVWSALPGRAPFVQTYHDVGVAVPWLAVSLDPYATFTSGLSLLPGIALFLAGLTLQRLALQRLSYLTLALCCLSLVFGILQVADGPSSLLRPYARTNAEAAVGFFANKNHFATLLAAGIPLTAAWAVHLLEVRSPRTGAQLLPCLGVFGALLVGLGTSNSRAGILLGLMATLGSLALLWISVRKLAVDGRSRAILAAAMLGAALAAGTVLFALSGNLSVSDELRAEFVRVTVHMAEVFGPPGSGFGTFEPLYEMFQRRPVPGTLINHAHNDWVELYQEGGWPTLGVMAAFLVWFVAQCWFLWRSSGAPNASRLALPRAGSLIAGLLLLHSIVDYPLRTAAHMTLFAFACVLMLSRSCSSNDISRSAARA